MPLPQALHDHALITRSLNAVPYGIVALSPMGKLLYANTWAAVRLADGGFLALWDAAGRERLQAELAMPEAEGLRTLDLTGAEGLPWRLSIEPWRGAASDEPALLVSWRAPETTPTSSGRMAHDFNNLLQVISGNLQLLAGDVAGNPRA